MSVVWNFPEPPSANRYWRHARGRTYLSKEALVYRKVVMYATANADPIRTGPVVLTLYWHRKIKSGDLDNRLKQLLDALKGRLYTDDKQIIEIHAYRADTPPKGRVILTVRPTEEIV